MNDGPFLDLFFEMLRSERGAAANTLDAYRRDLAEFQRSIDHHRPDLRSNIALADDVDIRAFLADLLDSGQSARSAARKPGQSRTVFGMNARAWISVVVMSVSPSRSVSV